MSELQRALTGDSAATPAENILEGFTHDLAIVTVAGAPHSIYEELWHTTFWQELTLDWVNRIETLYPAHAALGFPRDSDIAGESWDDLCRRFLKGLQQAADLAGQDARLDEVVRCTSKPGSPIREMTVREQLESLAAHNAYHLGRIVLLRQLSGSWPPASGGSVW